MESSVRPGDPAASPASSAPTDAAAQKLTALTSLLENLDEAPPPDAARTRAELSHQNRLVQVRLGVASGLFASLRAKHPPTAAHCLRVALGCSSWSLNLEISDELRDEIEVAALLHDMGKVGVPDRILSKPGKLTEEEAAEVESHRQRGLEILAACSASREIHDIVHYASAWYDGTRRNFDRRGDLLPLGARMLAIVDAFDSMTTDHVWRRAMSRERAVAELFECAGAQFDPGLTREFCSLLSADQVKFSAAVARRWLQELHPEASNALWCLGQLAPGGKPEDGAQNGLFQQRLLDTMQDAVVFVDRDLRILLWNRAAERLTGIPASSVQHQRWSPTLVTMTDERYEVVTEQTCPVTEVIQSGAQTVRRLSILGRDGKDLSIDVQLAPVAGRDGLVQGATLLMHDASSQITLEERVQSLHEKATRDPLTSVANRAEFDRVHAQFVATHLEQGLPCSLIICDIDFFKRINDTYGHQAGDEALVSFAALLRRHHRTGDLVARYGGEEFVMLCADCDNATATGRAEEIRRDLAETPHPSLGGKSITASFGVTEIQDGDTPETMLRRADRALLQAKDLGRNTVVQLGTGIIGDAQKASKPGWLASLFGRTPPDQLLERRLVTAVPLKVTVEKLRGFVADHHAEIVSIEEEFIVLKIDGQFTPLQRRTDDRAVPFCIELRFTESQFHKQGQEGSGHLRTLIDVAIRPQRNRDRRRRDVLERARQLISSLKSYLMAQDHSGSSVVKGEEESAGVLDKAKSMFGLWGGRPHESR
jgi:diguanylate cyclase (GGDEF)-like protein/PAS domain S-box-containing protein